MWQTEAIAESSGLPLPRHSNYVNAVILYVNAQQNQQNSNPESQLFTHFKVKFQYSMLPKTNVITPSTTLNTSTLQCLWKAAQQEAGRAVKHRILKQSRDTASCFFAEAQEEDFLIIKHISQIQAAMSASSRSCQMGLGQ